MQQGELVAYDEVRQLVYVGGYVSDSLAAVNVSDPTNPAIVGGVVVDMQFMDFAISVAYDEVRELVYVTGQASNSLAVVSVADPANPSTEGLDLSDILAARGWDWTLDGADVPGVQVAAGEPAEVPRTVRGVRCGAAGPAGALGANLPVDRAGPIRAAFDRRRVTAVRPPVNGRRAAAGEGESEER